jgi:hypothetical protein
LHLAHRQPRPHLDGNDISGNEAALNLGDWNSCDRLKPGGEHYWAFDTNIFFRLINYIVNRTLQDDKLIALRRAFIVYSQAGRPTVLLSSLQEAVAANQPLREELELLLNPSIPENVRQYQINHQERTGANNLDYGSTG